MANNENVRESKYCGCFTLKVATFLIAYSNLFDVAVIRVFQIIFTDDFDKVIRMIEGKIEIETEPIVIFALSVLFLILSLTFVIFLLVGLHKNVLGFVKAFIIYSYVYLGFFFIWLCFVLIIGVPFLAIVFPIGIFLIRVNLLLVLRNYYIRIMKMERSNDA